MPLSHFRRFLALAGGALSLWLTACSPVRTPLRPSTEARDQTMRMQIFLDSQHFGPGVIDGRPGEFTAKTLTLYRQSKGLSPDAIPDVSHIQPFTSYTIAAPDLATLGTMASEPEDQAKQQRLPYTALVELLSERFHTTQTFLRQINPGRDFDHLAAGDVITVPNVRRPFRADQFPSRYPAPSSGVTANRRVIVDTRFRMLQVREGNRAIAAFPITPGSTEHPAPPGEWKVAGVAPWPWYRYDEGVLKRGVRTETFYNLPPGPNSPVGIIWAGLNRPGVGIHGTTTPDTIGRAGSHGCIRLSNWDAAVFHTLIGKGMPVTIL